MFTVYVVEHITDLFLCQALAVQCACKSLTLFLLTPQHCENTWVKITVPVTRYPECQGAALTICMAHPEAVSLVARQAVLAQILTPLGYHHTLNHYLHQVLETIFSLRMLA